MAVFFSDLDRTLIYSHRHSIAGEKICVEYLNGQEQSYMTGFTHNFLTGNPGFSLVPLTTRTEAQYRRLTCMDAMNVRQAILCNGGKLLTDGAEDPDWTRETIVAAEAELPALYKAASLLRNSVGVAELHEPEPYMVYARCENPPAICCLLRSEVDPVLVQIAHDQRKVYLFCSSVNKGSAVRRFRKRFSVEYAIAAGDDSLDVPMLNEVDYAIAPVSIANQVQRNRKSVLYGEIISDGICRRLKEIITSRMKSH